MAALLARSADAPPANLDLTYQAVSYSTTASHTIPSGSGLAAGDLAVMHCAAQGSGAYTGAVPSGWTQIRYSRTTSGSSAVWGVIAYKVLSSGDIGSTLTGLPAGGGNEGSTILYFRPSKPITTVSLVTGINRGGDQATTATPADQAVDVNSANDPAYVAIVGYVANGTVTTRWTSVSMSEAVGRTAPYQFTKYKIYNIGATLEYITVTMADYGNNCLQSALLSVK